jgi:two-component system cell cycle response regulator
MARSKRHTKSGPGATVDGVGEVRAYSPEIVGATLTVLTGGEAGRFFTVNREGGVLGRGDDVTVTFTDETVSRSHASISLVDNGFELTDHESHNGTYLDGLAVRGSIALPRRCRIQLGTRLMLEYNALDELGAEAIGKLSNALLLDPLTGTGNRLHLEQRLAAETSFARRHHQALGLLLLDLDHFKRVNDEHGHLVGDRVLANVGNALTESCRTEDAVFRYGGEEFCILVRGLEMERLLVMAERIRVMIAELSVDTEETCVQVTTSIGVAALDLEDKPDAEEILLLADRALYRAKTFGRNRVELFEPD